MTKLSKKEIKIFCEKSKSKGNGHFIRSKRLYNFLKKKGFKCFLAVNNSSKEINRKIKKSKNQFFLILDYKNYNKINLQKNKKILKTIVVENLNKKTFYKNINIFPLDIQYRSYSGPEYYQYPKEFYGAKLNFKTREFKKKKISILIVQGGTDANNITKSLVRKITKKQFNFGVKFIVKTNNLNNLKKIKLLDNTYLVGRVKNIFALLKNIDIAVSACGGFAFELGYLGIPSIHVTSEKREIIRAKLFKRKKLGAFFYPKNINKIFDEINKIYYKKTYREMIIKNRINFFRKKNKILNLFHNYENV